MGSKLTRNSDGDLVIPSSAQGKLGELAPEAIALTKLYNDLLLSAQPKPGMRKRPLLYGDLRLFNVGEIIALIASMKRDGSLTLLVPDARKTVYFTAGEIIYASSNVEDDRLGEVLWRHGLLQLDQLTEVHDLVTPEKKLGAVLVEHKMITPRQLYDGIKAQVLDIVYSTFHFTQGEFLFVEGKVRLKGAVRLEMSTRDVIMSGIARLEEMTKLEELFPDRKMLLIKRPVAVETGLSDDHRKVLKLVDGKRNVDELINRSALGEMETLRTLAELRRKGAVDVRELGADEGHEDGTLPEVLQAYQRLFRLIHQTLLAETPDYVARLEAFIGHPPSRLGEIFRNVGFDKDGKLSPDDPRNAALSALRAFYDYAQFQAMDVLEDDACDRLMDRLHKIKSKIETDDEEDA